MLHPLSPPSYCHRQSPYLLFLTGRTGFLLEDSPLEDLPQGPDPADHRVLPGQMEEEVLSDLSSVLADPARDPQGPGQDLLDRVPDPPSQHGVLWDLWEEPKDP